MNPDISVIGDLRSWWVNEGDRNLGAEVHEVETSFISVIDPYARADVFISIHNEGAAPGHPLDDEHEGGFAFELEEAYLTTLSLPFKLQAKAGKFRNTFGKINRIHPHQLPFIDLPAPYVNFFGPEGLNDQGASVSWLLPNRKFYQELNVEFTMGPDNPSFSTSQSNKYLYTGHLKNFWDLTENATFELGFSGVAGPNDLDRTTVIGGVNMTYVWKPLRLNAYKSFRLQLEALISDRNLPSGASVTATALYAGVMYQLSRRWHVIGRFDYADLPDDGTWNQTGFSGFLGWYATEFQKIEFGLKTVDGPKLERTYSVLARLVFVIGTHGAHEY